VKEASKQRREVGQKPGELLRLDSAPREHECDDSDYPQGDSDAKSQKEEAHRVSLRVITPARGSDPFDYLARLLAAPAHAL
jgi:hypothetical protein